MRERDSGLDEPVHLEEHDPGWSERFAAERARLRATVGEDARIEHIGSTAVPGLVAKPIIDILVGVRSAVPLASVGERLRHAGYELLGDAGVPGRCHLRRRGRTSLNVSVVHVGSSLWSDNLRLRDHLRSDADARRRYADAKRRASPTATRRSWPTAGPSARRSPSSSARRRRRGDASAPVRRPWIGRWRRS